MHDHFSFTSIMWYYIHFLRKLSKLTSFGLVDAFFYSFHVFCLVFSSLPLNVRFSHIRS